MDVSQTSRPLEALAPKVQSFWNQKISTWRSSTQANLCCAECSACFRTDRSAFSYYRTTRSMSVVKLIRSSKKCRFCHYLCTIFAETSGQNIEDFVNSKEGIGIKMWMRGDHHWSNAAQNFVHVRFESGDLRDLFPEEWKFEVIGRSCRGFDRSYWNQPNSVDLDSRMTTIRGWSEDCEQNHRLCCKEVDESKLVPARFIRVGSEEQDLRACLIPGREIDRSAKYLVLSHCWGNKNIDRKSTTLQNLRAYEHSISVDKLPQTFRDAILITKKLGIQYLWIDSLCIVQDDEKDWQRESAKMADIYRNAFFTISATTAHNSDEGCGIDKALDAAVQVQIRAKSEVIDLCVRRRVWGASRSLLDGAPVHERAWIFQEKLLSRRILHVTNEQLIWQCAELIESEDGLEYEHSESVYPSLKTRHHNISAWRTLNSHLQGAWNERWPIRAMWWEWVRDFTKRKLTRPSDNYAALAGVTALYKRISEDEPILGLWETDLDIYLGWEADRDHTPPLMPPWTAAYPEPRQPTWTWMSFPHGSVNIMRPSIPFNWATVEQNPTGRLQFVYRVKVMNLNIRWTGEPLTSLPSQCSLMLRGKYFDSLRMRTPAEASVPRRIGDFRLTQTCQKRRRTTNILNCLRYSNTRKDQTKKDNSPISATFTTGT